MSRRPITQEQFDSVQKFPPSAAGEFVAEKTGLSVSTVRNIRKAKTWDKFQERRVALKRKESAERAMKPAPRPTPPVIGVTKAVQKPQGVGHAKTPEHASQVAALLDLMAKYSDRLDKYIKINNTALEEIHRGLADVTKDVAELKKYVAEKQKADEREAAKSRQRTNNPTFVDRLTRRLKS